jgi:hypothetical protein
MQHFVLASKWEQEIGNASVATTVTQWEFNTYGPGVLLDLSEVSIVWGAMSSSKRLSLQCLTSFVDSSWNVMAHGDEHEWKWRGNWRIDWVTSTPHTTFEHVLSRITTADVQNSTTSSRTKWLIRQFKWNRPFRRKTNYCFCTCAFTFQLSPTKFLSFSRWFRILEISDDLEDMFDPESPNWQE